MHIGQLSLYNRIIREQNGIDYSCQQPDKHTWSLRMHQRFGRSFGSDEYQPFLHQFGSAEAVAESAELQTFFIELKICETVIAVIELPCVATFTLRNTLF